MGNALSPSFDAVAAEERSKKQRTRPERRRVYAVHWHTGSAFAPLNRTPATSHPISLFNSLFPYPQVIVAHPSSSVAFTARLTVTPRSFVRCAWTRRLLSQPCRPRRQGKPRASVRQPHFYTPQTPTSAVLHLTARPFSRTRIDKATFPGPLQP
ncbi:hypothetical protein BU26DRAFT_164371 [Trematosphaeria pertusa]|uniref:Uncharacterized protein n=1 Tax=Trematosphaeria pertusa TaxID=390896 RepID=A0A6A6HV33_9PLEO|nr:uncharacterized protein BU26DRAFT_164371 [Trematosphaeria pertusa]KAF2242055.1 hypothetical protein BU26DRAFT_164371 [Trematosphaeria pertusa]